MYVDKFGNLYFGDMRIGDREATASEVAAWQTSRTPDPQDVMTRAIQKRLDDFALTKGYDDVNSLAKYANLTDAEIASLPAANQATVTRYRTQCRYLQLKVAQTWAASEVILGEVQTGTRPMPIDIADIEAELPALTWPN